jgi:hypothetical protein
MPQIIGECVDRLRTIEMRPGEANVPRGVIHKLYEAARDYHGGSLTLSAAEGLIRELDAGYSVFILTGAGGPPIWPCGKVDGLLGSASIAHTLQFLRGARPILPAEPRVEAPLRATCRAAGLTFRSQDELSSVDHSVLFVPVPVDAAACREQVDTLLDEHEPRVIIAIEKLSPNDVGGIPRGDWIELRRCTRQTAVSFRGCSQARYTHHWHWGRRQ